MAVEIRQELSNLPDAPSPTAVRNKTAGRLLQELRTERGLSREALSYAIFRAELGTVSARTIARIESQGAIPHVRVQFAVARFFERPVTSIWPISKTRRAA